MPRHLGFFWVGCLLLVLSPYTFGQQSSLQLPDANESQISIYHHGCRGRCAIYKLTLLPSGTVLYNGIRHVKTVGSAQTHIEPSTYQILLHKFVQIKFFSLPECGLVDDADMISTTVSFNGQKKTLAHTPHTIDCNIELEKLEEIVETTVGSKQWTK